MRRKLGVAASFLILVLWGWQEVRGDSSASSLFSRRELEEVPQDITVGVYYYPWHGADFHRGDGYVRKSLDPPHRPTLGEYDDSKPETIAQHLTWSRQANVKLWVCSWWGPRSREDTTIKNVILPHSNLQDHKIALLYETMGRITEAQKWDTTRIASDMKYICPTYFSHPNYYRIDGRPVMFVYLTRVLNSKGVLANVISVMRANCPGYDMYLVGDQVWRTAPALSTAYAPFDHLDAVTNYDIYGNINNAPYAGQTAVDNYYNEQVKWRASANAKGVGYAVAASPGYNDRGVRLQNDNKGLSRKLTAVSEQGSLFAAQLVKARLALDPTMGNLLMINSFNEWHEDSQIEPCVGAPTTLPLTMTNGLEYSGYGELYLNILREATCDQKCRTKLQLPNNNVIVGDNPFLGSPPTDLLVGAYYFAWHGADFNGQLPYLRSKLANPQWPGLGEYDDAQSYVIAEHLSYSRRANIGLWITRWVAPGTREDLAIRNSILPHPDLGGHLISLLYQTDIFQAGDYDPSKLTSDMEYICDAYFTSQSYYSINGRPVMFLSLSRLLDRLGLLASVTSLIRTVASSFGYNIYLVGDHVWRSPPSSGALYMPFLLLDAVTNVDVYGNMNATGYAGQAAVDAYYQTQLNWRNSAWSRRCGFIPGATPGFNNLRNKPLSRDLVAGYEEGSLFASSLKKARHLVDSNVDNLVVVNSFNNWFEDTQIEPVTGRTTTLPLDVTGGLEYPGYGNLYLDILREATIDANSSNEQDYSTVDDTFYPLECNLAKDMTSACSTTWSSTFGITTKYQTEIVIPCGKCITMDRTGTLALDGGLDIQGALVIPDGVKLELRAPYIRVQGELHASSTKIVDGKPDLKFTIWEGASGIEKFMPADVNRNACKAQKCQPGSKSIVVAGGKIQIQGLPYDSPTWVNLHDVVTDIAEPSFRLPLSCPTDGYLINEKFTSPHSDAFSGTPGSTSKFTGYSLKVVEREMLRHGVQTDLASICNCLSAGRNYTVSLKLRLDKDGQAGKATECAQTSQGCLKVYTDRMDELELLSSSMKFSEAKGLNFKYGEWTTFQAKFNFNELELKKSNIYLLLRIGGVGKGVDIELESFSLRMSPEEACSTATPDCRNLIACNGNADLGLTALSPISARGTAELKVEEEDGNPFWRIRRLGTSDVLAGIQFQLPTTCMKASAVYRFRMRIRVYPDNKSPAEIETAVYFGSSTLSLLTGGTSKSFKIGACPKSSGDWVICEDYIVMPNLNPILQKVSLYIETARSPTVNYDIDDVSFEYLHMERPVTGLVVDGSVKSKWGIGAEILITSHSIDWNGEQVRKIANITDFGVDGKMLIKLNTTITRPPVAKSSAYAAEVSLLSRNIVFEGARDDGADPVRGGHLMVYRTPDVVQIIEGVEFKNMGQQGVAGRFPIYFNYCGSIAGSRIAKNSIRDSNQRCIVLAGTDNASVEENIAYNTAGHCFVLQDGMESGNRFVRNLGVKTRTVVTAMPGDESDGYPSTFFSASADNTWEENVAAGSEADGFSIELQSSVKGLYAGKYSSINPAALPLTLFQNNVAHSNQRNGVRLSLPLSYIAQAGSSIEFKAVRVYRNLGVGMLLMNGASVTITDGEFADNRKSIRLHHCENATVKDTTLVGMTSETRQLEATQHGKTLLCPDRRALIGIELDSLNHRRTGDGLTVDNLRVLGFSDMICRENVFRVDPEIGWGFSDYSSSFSNIEISDEAPRLTLCDAHTVGIQDIYMIDQDSSLKPANSTARGVSVLVSDHPNMRHFITDSANKCVSDARGCYRYCPQTCLRSVSYSIDPADPNEYSLRVCERGNLNNCILYEGHSREELDTSDRFVRHAKLYYVALPTGRYEAAFIDTTSKVAWPTFAEEVYHPALCNGAVADGAIWLQQPSNTTMLQTQCLGLIRNGGADWSNTTYPYWLAGPKGIQLAANKGITTSGSGNLPSNALCQYPNANQRDQSYSMGQYIDTRCLTLNRRYSVKAWVRRSTASNWEAFLDETTCSKNCVEAGFHLVRPNGSTFTIKLTTSKNIFVTDTSGNRQRGLLRNLQGLENSYNGFSLVEGELVVTADVASAVSAFFYIHSNHEASNVTLCVDNVSMNLVV